MSLVIDNSNLVQILIKNTDPSFEHYIETFKFIDGLINPLAWVKSDNFEKFGELMEITFDEMSKVWEKSKIINQL